MEIAAEKAWISHMVEVLVGHNGGSCCRINIAASFYQSCSVSTKFPESILLDSDSLLKYALLESKFRKEMSPGTCTIAYFLSTYF